jgi:very-short-patch-repair endonuclease
MARRRGKEEGSFASPDKIQRARELRRAMTAAERVLWAVLRGKALGLRVRPQHVIRGWIVDFYIFAASLVIEVDGDVHDLQREDDERRTEALQAEGLTVLRVRNDEVLTDPSGVVKRIIEVIHAPRASPPAGLPQELPPTSHSLPTNDEVGPHSLPPLVGAGPGVGAPRRQRPP